MRLLPFWRRRRQQALEEEIRTHLQYAIQERIERGEDPREAARAAQKQFGNTLLIQEVTRAMWGWTSLERLWQDVRYGLRLLVKAPGFTLLTVLTLAIGIGANTAVFSLVNTLVLRPLYPEIGRLIVIEDTPAQEHGKNLSYKMSYPKYLAWKQQRAIFESLGAMYPQGPSLTGLGEPERLQAANVSAEFLPLLGISPMLGRGFRSEDEPFSAPPVVLLSYRFWRTHFPNDSDVLGRKLRLNDELCTIIGVLPEHASLGSSLFRGSSAFSFDVVMPLRVDESHSDPSSNYLVVIGKVKPALSIPAATSAIESESEAINQSLGSTNKTQIIPLETYLIGEARSLLFILMGAVIAVLLITCANAASLLLARGVARQKEIAVRLALGARRIRIFRQFLIESLLLSLIGGFSALAFLWAVREGLVSLLADRLPSGVGIAMDRDVVIFTFGLSLLTGLLFGVVPAWQTRKPDIRDALGQGGRASTAAGSQRIRNTLVVAEIACSLALLAGAGLLLRSFVRLMNVDKGYASDHTLTMRFWAGLSYTPETHRAYLNAILQRVRELPGVESVGFSSNLPLGGNMTSGGFGIQGRPFDPSNRIIGSKMLVGGDYFRTLHIPLIAGRFFTPQDEQPNAPLVTIVDRSFATRYFPGENAVGQHLNFAWGGNGWTEIVGVVGSIKEMSLAAEPLPTVYAPIAQRGTLIVHSNVFLAVRSGGDPMIQARAVKDVIHGLNSEQIVEHVGTMDNLISDSVASSRAPMWLFAVFAGIAALLAAIGVYGVLSYYVVQRRHEIGTRMALGAQRTDVLGLVLRHGAGLILAGVLAGLAISLATTRVLTSLLFGTRPTDVGTLVVVCFLLAIIGLLACAVPVLRATRVDPQVVLRNE